MVTPSKERPQVLQINRGAYCSVSEEPPGQTTGISSRLYAGLRGSALAKLTLESHGPQKAKGPMC